MWTSATLALERDFLVFELLVVFVLAIPVFAFVLIGILYSRLSDLRMHTDWALEELRVDGRRRDLRIEELVDRRHTEAAPAVAVVPPVPVFTPSVAPVAVIAVVEPVAPRPIPPALPPRLIIAAPRPQPAEPAPPASAPAAVAQAVKSTGGWEAMIGGNLLNKLGALILVIGIALFLGHSFTQMGAAGRAASGLAIGAAILAGGLRLERIERYRLFSRGLIAAGWAALYFTTYAMSAVSATKVIDNPVIGVLLMVAVAAGMVLHSLRYKVESLTALAFGCVFAALALSELNTLTTTALVPLALSMLYLGRRFAWDGLPLLGAAATYVTFLSRESTGAPLAAVQGMLFIYWLLFEASDLLRIAARRPEGQFGPSLFAVNALAGLGASAAIWNRMAPAEIWQFCAAGAVLYLASTVIRFCLDGHQTRYEFTLAFSAFLAGVAIFAHVPGLWRSVGMMLEAEALFLAGLYLGLRWARALSLTAFAVSAWELFQHSGVTTVIGGVTVHQLAPPLAILALIFYLNRYLAKDSLYFGYAASAMVAILIGGEIPWRFASIGWLLFGAVLFEFGVARGLPDIRFQSYALTLLGATGAGFGHIDPQQAVTPWTYAFAMAVSLLRAIRATSSLNSLPDDERSGLRISGAMGTALMSGLWAAKLIPGDYLGLAVMLLALGLVELACRRLPAELAIPALLLSAAGLAHLIVQHVDAIAKHPAQAVWISFAGGALACFVLAARLLHRDEPGAFKVAHLAAPWAGSALAMAALWMMLPAAAVPIAWGLLAMAVAEAGVAAGAMDMLALGSLILLAAAAICLDTVAGRLGNGAVLAGMHWVLWYRLRDRCEFAAWHGSAAVGLIAAVSGADLPSHYLLVWSGLGVGIVAAAHRLPERKAAAALRWQAAALGFVALWAGVWLGSNVSGWHHGIVALWFLIALALEPREGGTSEILRPGYSVAAGLVMAAALFREVSGGMLTLSWSGEGIILLSAGFLLRERTLRLSGLALLLGCIGKAFLYDLRHLETTYRILSFVGLGAILLLVSGVYTRFKDSLQKHL